MKASKQWTEQSILDWGARNPTTVVRVAKTAMLGLKGLPNRTIVRMMDHPKDGELALSLLRQPNYARNFFELGLEEIRDVPETIDVSKRTTNGFHLPYIFHTACMNTHTYNYIYDMFAFLDFTVVAGIAMDWMALSNGHVICGIRSMGTGLSHAPAPTTPTTGTAFFFHFVYVSRGAAARLRELHEYGTHGR
jgi:hypothetical protein